MTAWGKKLCCVPVSRRIPWLPALAALAASHSAVVAPVCYRTRAAPNSTSLPAVAEQIHGK